MTAMGKSEKRAHAPRFQARNNHAGLVRAKGAAKYFRAEIRDLKAAPIAYSDEVQEL
eukprot:CAMPEP_0113673012 /NCGR_PEP_ID=MMETSP0038_2-20120614/6612_1 /TAXON_ID=2898 /ORGANISM="Cryptomonas paramecium" /LENGTH=56 /DNA_ID=CAMNT_0000589405 /DNA_START=292 /DNA_END=460 /DNA_ORIENTATION=- /assembly_acc=CAM_ASM_000170